MTIMSKSFLFFFTQNKKSNVNKTPTTIQSIHCPTLQYWIGTCFIPVILLSFRLSVMTINYVNLATCLIALRTIIFMLQPVKKQKRTQMNPLIIYFLSGGRIFLRNFYQILWGTRKWCSFQSYLWRLLVFLHWPPATRLAMSNNDVTNLQIPRLSLSFSNCKWRWAWVWKLGKTVHKEAIFREIKNFLEIKRKYWHWYYIFKQKYREKYFDVRSPLTSKTRAS